MIVVNRHHQKEDWPEHSYYVGRPGRIADEEIARGAIDATRLGNPYTVGQHGDKAMPMYKRWLWVQIKGDPLTRELLQAIPEPSRLICSCFPKPCHGNLIKDAWEAKAWEKVS